MGEERDIDEILASLDALLKEGNSRHDDTVAEHAYSKSDIQPAEDERVKDTVSTDVATDLNSDEMMDVTVPDDEQAIETVEDDVVMREKRMHRVVLTEEMLVDNSQVSLPLGFVSEEIHEPKITSEEKGVVSEPSMSKAPPENEAVDHVVQDAGDSERVMHLHKQDVEQLFALVSQDISDHFRSVLPQLIEESLHAHLTAMQHEFHEKQKNK